MFISSYSVIIFLKLFEINKMGMGRSNLSKQTIFYLIIISTILVSGSVFFAFATAPVASNDGPSNTGGGFATDEDTPFTSANVIISNDTHPGGILADLTLTNVVNTDAGGPDGTASDPEQDGTIDFDPNGQFESLDVGDFTIDVFYIHN